MNLMVGTAWFGSGIKVNIEILYNEQKKTPCDNIKYGSFGRATFLDHASPPPPPPPHTLLVHSHVYMLSVMCRIMFASCDNGSMFVSTRVYQHRCYSITNNVHALVNL